MDLARVAAVATVDFRTRLRRPSTAVLVLVSAVLSCLAVPDPATGAGLLRIGHSRALYTSTTLAFATAALLALVLSLLGFYLVSNGLKGDRRTRIASVVAASPVRNVEYLLGKLAGNVALLVAVTLGALAAAAAMQIIRGEGPLEPATFLAYYAVLLPTAIAWVAAIALVFECATALSGRAGDVVYFFVWTLVLSLSAEPWRAPGAPLSWLGNCLDFTGMGFVVSQVERLFGRADFSIGYSRGATGAPVLFPGPSFTPEAVATRAWAFVIPLVLFALATALFRRFDPAYTRVGRDGGRRSFSSILGILARPLGRPMLALLDRVSPDAALTFRARPPLVLLAATSAILGLTLPAVSLRAILLPILFVVLSAALADVATRERGAGFAPIVWSAPGRRDGFVQWKLGTAALAALLLAGVPTARLLIAEPSAGLSALVGLLFLAAASVALGVATGTPKAFTALSLVLWYLV